MSYSSKNHFYHGIMFHHFHDNKKYHKTQGSIDANKLYKMIDFLGRKNILDADEFIDRYKKKKT